MPVNAHLFEILFRNYWATLLGISYGVTEVKITRSSSRRAQQLTNDTRAAFDVVVGTVPGTEVADEALRYASCSP